MSDFIYILQSDGTVEEIKETDSSLEPLDLKTMTQEQINEIPF